MPTYTYQCENKECNCMFEIVQKITDKPIEQCPDCNQKVHKVINNGNFLLKGYNWTSRGRC